MQAGALLRARADTRAERRSSRPRSEARYVPLPPRKRRAARAPRHRKEGARAFGALRASSAFYRANRNDMICYCRPCAHAIIIRRHGAYIATPFTLIQRALAPRAMRAKKMNPPCLRRATPYHYHTDKEVARRLR